MWVLGWYLPRAEERAHGLDAGALPVLPCAVTPDPLAGTPDTTPPDTAAAPRPRSLVAEPRDIIAR